MTPFTTADVPGAAAADPLLALRPSFAPTAMRCPGACRLAAMVLEQQDHAAEQEASEDDSADAARGKRLHAVLAATWPLDDAARETVLMLEELPADDEAQVRHALHLADRFVYGIALLGDRDEITFYTEAELPTAHLGWRLPAHVDGLAINHGTGRGAVIDWKMGGRAVQGPARNPQVITYVCAAAAEHRLTDVHAAIIRPAADEPWDLMAHAWGESEIHDAAVALRQLALDVRAPVCGLVAGPHCLHCPAAGHCPAQAHAEAVLLSLLPVESMNPDQLARAIALTEAAAERRGAIKAEAMRRLMADGSAIPGWRLGHKRGQRVWGDGLEEQAAAEIAAVLEAKGRGALAPSIWRRSLLPPAQVEKLTGKARDVLARLAPLQAEKAGGAFLARDTKGAAPAAEESADAE